LKALILAAGYAKRLWPLTKNKPKPLLEVKGKTIVGHILENMKSVKEIDEVLIVTNEKFAMEFEYWVKDFEYPKPIKIVNDMTSSNDDRRGAVGDIDFTIKDLKLDDELMIIAGDNLFEYKISDFYNFYKKKGTSIVACRDMKDKELVKERFGVVEIDKEKKVVGFEEKPVEPKSTLAATACYIFTKTDVKEIDLYLQPGNSPDNAGDFVAWLSRHKPVHAFIFTENWFDIGSFENLGKAREEFNG